MCHLQLYWRWFLYTVPKIIWISTYIKTLSVTAGADSTVYVRILITYTVLYCISVYGPQTRHISLHLLQLSQAGFLKRIIRFFWDSVPAKSCTMYSTVLCGTFSRFHLQKYSNTYILQVKSNRMILKYDIPVCTVIKILFLFFIGIDR